MGKAKVAPTLGQTIPRLELCAGVLGIEITEIIREQMERRISSFTLIVRLLLAI